MFLSLRMPTARALLIGGASQRRQPVTAALTNQLFGVSRVSGRSRTTTTTTLHATSTTQTQYTIDCARTDPETLETVVTKHVKRLDRYLSSKPIAEHTRAAFSQLLQQKPDLLDSNNSKLILDSGCGTGRSSLVLGELFPECFVIGVDRSIVRLRKNPKVPRKKNSRNINVVEGNDDEEDATDDTDSDDSDDDSSDEDKDDDKILVQQVAPNVWLVRAELVGFWNLLLQNNCHVHHHYMLYPNPYPKPKRLKQRWYAHPSFPLLLHLGGERLTVRSNWSQYLDEFSIAAQVVAGLDDSDACTGLPAGTENPARRFFVPLSEENDNVENDAAVTAPPFQPTVVQRLPSAQKSWTNFEEKYDVVGEATFELVLQSQSATVR